MGLGMALKLLSDWPVPSDIETTQNSCASQSHEDTHHDLAPLWSRRIRTAVCELVLLEERQRPMHQIQPHVRVRVPLFQAVHLDTVPPKLRIAQV